MNGEYQAERLDKIREHIERIENGTDPQFCPLKGEDLLIYWKRQEEIGELYLTTALRQADGLA